MIAPKPGSLPYRLLETVVRAPGEYRVAELWPTLLPLPPEWRRTTPYRLPGQSVVAAGKVYAAWHRDREVLIRDRVKALTRQAGRLTDAGFLEPLQPPRLSDRFTARLEAAGGTDAAIAALVMAAHPLWERDRRDRGDGGVSAAVIDIVRAVERSPVSMRGASGHRQRVYRDLVGLGVIEAPAERWPTSRGVAWIARGGRREAAVAEDVACQA